MCPAIQSSATSALSAIRTILTFEVVAGDARLRHFKQSTPDPVMIADAHLVVGKPVDGEVLPELAVGEVAAAEPVLPIAIRGHLIDEDGPVLAAMPARSPCPSPSMLSRRTIRRP
jgi:hypothetical protein